MRGLAVVILILCNVMFACDNDSKPFRAKVESACIVVRNSKNVAPKASVNVEKKDLFGGWSEIKTLQLDTKGRLNLTFLTSGLYRVTVNAGSEQALVFAEVAGEKKCTQLFAIKTDSDCGWGEAKLIDAKDAAQN